MTLLMGAVAYDPKVVTIWDGFQKYFAKHGLDFDYILYSNYERQVEAQISGQIHVAWNSPLAWLQTERVAARMGRSASAVCMRDSDCDLTSVVIVRSDSAIRDLGDLKGKRMAVGASDSPQATLIPLHHLSSKGLKPRRDFTVVGFDLLVGKHGDHIGGEREAVKALMRGEVDAACLIDANLLAFTQEGTIGTGSVRVLSTTDPYDHCNFTTYGEYPMQLVGRFIDLLLGMSYADPEVRPLLDLEGLKKWVPGRTSGYQALSAAIDEFGTVDAFVEDVSRRCS
jgi:ABC-type phosphate/phosphonate transport system substrate-binding protein